MSEELRQADGHWIVSESTNRIICRCGAVLTNYGLLKSVASLYGKHLKDNPVEGVTDD